MHASSLCLVCGTPNGIGYTGASLAFMVQSSFLLIIYCNTWALGINQHALKILCHWQHCHLRPTRLHFGCGNGGRWALSVLGFGLHQSLFQHWMQAPSHKKRKTAAYLWPPDTLTNMAGRSSKETQSWSSPSSPTSIGIVVYIVFALQLPPSKKKQLWRSCLKLLCFLIQGTMPSNLPARWCGWWTRHGVMLRNVRPA